MQISFFDVIMSCRGKEQLSVIQYFSLGVVRSRPQFIFQHCFWTPVYCVQDSGTTKPRLMSTASSVMFYQRLLSVYHCEADVQKLKGL